MGASAEAGKSVFGTDPALRDWRVKPLKGSGGKGRTDLRIKLGSLLMPSLIGLLKPRETHDASRG